MSVESLVAYFKELSVDVSADVRWESLKQITHAIVTAGPEKFDLGRLERNRIDGAAITALADVIVTNQQWLMDKDSGIVLDDLIHAVAKDTAGNLCLDCKSTDPFGIRPYIYPAIYDARHPAGYKSAGVICDDCNESIDGDGVHFMGQNKDLCARHLNTMVVSDEFIPSYFIHRLNGTHPLSMSADTVDRNKRAELLNLATDVLYATEAFKEQKARYKGSLNIAFLTDEEVDIVQNSLVASSYTKLPIVRNQGKPNKLMHHAIILQSC